jgi:hypothetical protein
VVIQLIVAYQVLVVILDTVALQDSVAIVVIQVFLALADIVVIQE